MIIRSKAPLRLGLAGGGTDLSPYYDQYGGMVLNATIDLYAFCSIEVRDDQCITFQASDRGEQYTTDSTSVLPIDGKLDLHKGIYNRIVKEFNGGSPLSFHMTTYADAPAGSGLGTSSTMVVAILKAFVEWLNLPLGEYDIAHLAYEIERHDIGLSGGKQDQYAATFGGFNFMEFYADDRVIVNPLRIKNWIIDELESSIVLYFSGTSRESAKIIDEQKVNVSAKHENAIQAMHEVKQDAYAMKEAVLKGEITQLANILGKSWESKKRMANAITNSHIDAIHAAAIAAGAFAGKVSGAGGGGFLIFIVDPAKRLQVVKVLNDFGHGHVMNFHFVKEGTRGWKIR